MNKKIIDYINEHTVDLEVNFEEYDPYKIDLSNVLKLNYKNNKKESNLEYINEIVYEIEDRLVEDFFLYEISYYFEELIEDLNLNLDPIDIMNGYSDYIVFNSIKDEILEEYKVCVDILIDKDNLNYEGSKLNGSIIDLINYLNEEIQDPEIDEVTLELFKSQEYKLKDLNKDIKSIFIETFRDEISEYIDMPLVYTLHRESNLKDIINLVNSDYIEIDEDDVFGLFDPVSGSGSLMEITVEKPFKVPTKMIYLSNSYNSSYGYSTLSVYGDLI